ncbi:lysophospholipase [Trichoderma cornu-damae]|uniref:Lysophospholipase n=1 Tax=Trichoderma cornu-damae TaxID=654480 RepID=A0A9P8QG00_9HYPO|nr:lysophospholipase [Trichoderma cornu-damae]
MSATASREKALTQIIGTAVSPGIHALSPLAERAVPDAPDGYTPARVSCPANRPTVRAATGLSSNETDWLPLRTNNTVQAMKGVLSRANIGNIDTDRYIDNLTSVGAGLPRVAIAISGGGYRALMNGAGALAAFDNRSTNATETGHLGGLLQSATYLSGLSGGSWLVGSLYVQNFTSVESIIFSTTGFLSTLWQFDQSILKGMFPDRPSGLSVTRYYRELFDAVDGKGNAGFNTTITDYWGRALSYQLVNATDGGPAYTFSSISNDTDFATAQAPMPLIVAIERTSGQLQVASNSTIFEFNPWEMGSYDPGLEAFAPLKFVGSNFTNGSIPRDGECFAGVDNAGFVMGTSSSLFNQAFLQIGRVQGVPDFLIGAINATLANIGEENRDVASWPNPFFRYNTSGNANANATVLTLVDGGEDLQNIPLHPLLLAEREVDVIFAVDGSADTETLWPNGTAMVATFNRSEARVSANDSNFPDVPDQNTFVNLGLNRRPTFFGCTNGSGTPSGPLIVYLPNAPYSFHSNVSTFDLEYSDEERDQIIQNGYNMATMGNGTVDSNWPACVGCAILARSLVRTRASVPAKCADCFARYCWNGTTNSTLPNTYEPAQILQGSTEQSTSSAGRVGGTLLLACVVLMLAI